MYDNHWYGAVGSYHDTQASSGPAAGLSGWAPYLRVAYQMETGAHNASLGGYAMRGDFTANTSAPASTNTAQFRDTGADFQFQYLQDVNTVTLRANYINEKLEDAVNIGAGKESLNIRNVMVNGDGRVKVLDFGLAKLREHEATEAMGFHPQTSLTQEGLAIGTLAYMAPVISP